MLDLPTSVIDDKNRRDIRGPEKPQNSCNLGPPSRTFLTVRQTAERFPAFTEAAIRSLIFYAKTTSKRKGSSANGFADVIVRVPGQRKVLLCEQRLIDWILSSQNSQ